MALLANLLEEFRELRLLMQIVIVMDMFHFFTMLFSIEFSIEFNFKFKKSIINFT